MAKRPVPRKKGPAPKPKAKGASQAPAAAPTALAALRRVEQRLERLETLLEARAAILADPQDLAEPGLVSSLNLAESRVLEDYGHRRKVAAGQLLFAEGDQGDEMFVVVEGVVESYKKDFLGDLRLSEIRTGGVVGEMALIEGKPRSANVRAVEDAVVLALHRAGYERLKAEQPRIATKLQDELLQIFSNRLRQTTEKMMGQV